jgi:hypothetical protein
MRRQSTIAELSRDIVAAALMFGAIFRRLGARAIRALAIFHSIGFLPAAEPVVPTATLENDYQQRRPTWP